MGDFICRAVCWAMAAGIAIVAAIAINAFLAPNAILLFMLGLFIFALLAFALPAMICSLPRHGEAQPVGHAVPAPAAAAPHSFPAPVAGMPSAPQRAPAKADSWTDTVGASGKASDTRGPTGLKPSVSLAEEATVRDSVGTWRYEGESADAPASAAPTNSDTASDGSGVDASEGVKPATLSAARGGKPDDLKQIKGVGPKMEGLLNSLGFFHFDQIASWSDQQVAWVDANLEGFKGRVSRDNWVEQAKVLATGGETEFSKRVEDGDVY